jgi:hypothetical protein
LQLDLALPSPPARVTCLWATYWAANIPANWWSKVKQCNEWNILSRVD